MLFQEINQYFQKHNLPENLFVALSGGADSVALLHLLWRFRAAFSGSLNLTALHVHHGLHENADIWAQFCENLCEKWQIPFILQKVQVQAKNLGVEGAARQARYAAFAEKVGAGSIALAHHADDQVETLLLAVLRGGGLRALAAMPPVRVSGSLTMLRPLLNVRREQIQQYIQQHNLPHIHDSSNDNPDFLRNWVRHDLLPHMVQRVPNVAQHILRGVDVLQDELFILNNVLDENWQNVYAGDFLWRKALTALSLPEMKNVLLKFCQTNQLGTPTKHSLNDFAQYLQANQHDGARIWHLPQGEMWAYRQKLWAWHNTQIQQYQHDTQYFSGSLNLAPALTWLPEKYGLAWDALNQHAIVRPHRAHDRIHTPNGSKTVVKLLQDKHIPPALRPNWLVVEQSGKCVAVANLAVCRSVAVENGWLPEWALTKKFTQ